MMRDLVEFLRARLDEDTEQVRNWGCDCMVEGFSSQEHGIACEKRVQSEVKAKRRIIDRYERLLAGPFPQLGIRYLWQSLVDLAQPYADHPDFDPEWKLRV
jgi:hypothetical protein